MGGIIQSVWLQEKSPIFNWSDRKTPSEVNFSEVLWEKLQERETDLLKISEELHFTISRTTSWTLGNQITVSSDTRTTCTTWLQAASWKQMAMTHSQKCRQLGMLPSPNSMMGAQGASEIHLLSATPGEDYTVALSGDPTPLCLPGCQKPTSLPRPATGAVGEHKLLLESWCPRQAHPEGQAASALSQCSSFRRWAEWGNSLFSCSPGGCW